jgi:electron-transferring-flavoprotein dehydrogenase
MSEDRETLEVDVLIVGAGPAGLAAAYRMTQLPATESLSVVVLEKGKEVGSHTLSGAVLDPRSIEELIPDWRQREAPVAAPVARDEVRFLTRAGSFRLPILPPPLRNHGNFIISLGRFVRWLGARVEEAGVDLLTGIAGAELLVEDDRLVGVRTGDRGIDRKGNRKGNFEPGVDVRAKVTVLAEGVRGSLTKQAIERFSLDAGRNPQVYSVGVKEVWQVPSRTDLPGRVIHTMGFPLSSEEFGGGFLYGLSEDRVSV